MIKPSIKKINVRIGIIATLYHTPKKTKKYQYQRLSLFAIQNYLQTLTLMEFAIVSPAAHMYDLLTPVLSTHHESGIVSPSVPPVLSLTATAQYTEDE
jgi:hypothetical protein